MDVRKSALQFTLVLNFVKFCFLNLVDFSMFLAFVYLSPTMPLLTESFRRVDVMIFSIEVIGAVILPKPLMKH